MIVLVTCVKLLITCLTNLSLITLNLDIYIYIVSSPNYRCTLSFWSSLEFFSYMFYCCCCVRRVCRVCVHELMLISGHYLIGLPVAYALSSVPVVYYCMLHSFSAWHMLHELKRELVQYLCLLHSNHIVTSTCWPLVALHAASTIKIVI